MLKEIQHNSKGITLISLVITAVVMSILTGVVVVTSTKNDGMIDKTSEASEAYNTAATSEEEDFNEVSTKMQDIKAKHSYNSTLAE